MRTMRSEDVIRALDAIECEMRHLEYRIHGIRSVLRNQIDPLHQRKDLGFFEDEGKSVNAGATPVAEGVTESAQK